jgi:hypothetical protein
MAKNTLNDLRDHLFAQLENLSDPDKPLEKEIERAKAMAALADRIIDGARVQVEFAEVTGQDVTGAFFPKDQPDSLVERIEPNPRRALRQ